MREELLRQGADAAHFVACPPRHIKSKGIMQTYIARAGEWEAAAAAWSGQESSGHDEAGWTISPAARPPLAALSLPALSLKAHAGAEAAAPVA